MLKGYFDSLPVEMEEAAVIDGANRFTIFWYLILPHLVGGLTGGFVKG
jgi:ABC-type glycerol-3-phosphate transport system permease component